MNIILEKFTSADIPKLISWVPSEDFLQQFCGKTFQYPLTETQLENYIKWMDTVPVLRYVYKAVDRETNLHIGNITLELSTTIPNAAALTCVIIGDENYRGRGAANRMISFVLSKAFDELNYDNVYLNVYKFNKSAIKCYKKAGFSKISENEADYAGKKAVNCLMMIRKAEWKDATSFPRRRESALFDFVVGDNTNNEWLKFYLSY